MSESVDKETWDAAFRAGRMSVRKEIDAWLDAVEPQMKSKMEALEQHNGVLESQLAETAAVLEWVEAALLGDPVSDFAESFPLVRLAMDVRAERDSMRDLAKSGGGLT